MSTTVAALPADLRCPHRTQRWLAQGVAVGAVLTIVALSLLGTGSAGITPWMVVLYCLPFVAAVSVVATRAVRTVVLASWGEAWPWLALSAATLAYLGATVLIAMSILTTGRGPEGVTVNGLFLLTYACLAAGLTGLAARRQRPGTWVAWMDGLALALSGCGVVTVVLADRVPNGATAYETPLSVAYAVLDTALVVLMLTVVSAHGGRPGRLWSLLSVSIIILAVGDLADALQQGDDEAVHTLPTLMWVVAMVFLTIAVLSPDNPKPARGFPGFGSLIVPLGASVVSIALLLHMALSPGRPALLAASLATLSLVVATLRAGRSFLDLQRLAEARLQATTDELTGTLNRRGFRADLAQALRRALETQARVALLLLDIDRFKHVNDSLGHQVGDQALIEMSERLAGLTRPSDRLARLGGDEFALVLPGADRTQAQAVSDRIRGALALPFTMAGVSSPLTAAVGIAIFPDDATDADDLLRCADVAMYAAKRLGRPVATYHPNRDEGERTRIETAALLRTACQAGDGGGRVVLHFQPQLFFDSGEVESVEALVRWEHPNRGLLGPGEFLPLASSMRLMPALTNRVLTLACDQLAAWRAEGSRLRMSVNLSAPDLVDQTLADRVSSMLAERDLDPGILTLEVTEDAIEPELDTSLAVLRQLRLLGVHLSIDDYGTGYSGLAHLRDLPVDELKVDQSFIRPLTATGPEFDIVKSTVELAHALGMTVIAEGLETPAALEALRTLNVDGVQGYLVSRPVAAVDLPRSSRIGQIRGRL